MLPNASSKDEFLCEPSHASCIKWADSIPSLRNETRESAASEPPGGDQSIETIGLHISSHELAHGSRNHRVGSTGQLMAADSSLSLKAWCHLKDSSTFRTGCKIPCQRRQAANDHQAGRRIELDLITERRKFVVELANNSQGSTSSESSSEAKVDNAVLPTREDLAAIKRLHSNLIPASYRATRDMSELIDRSWWSE